MKNPDETAHDVLSFWFEDTPPDKWFVQDQALDREIETRFRTARDRVVATRAEGWKDTPENLLAAIILVDQFSRNIYRGKAEAFAADPLGLELTRYAISQGWEQSYPPERRAFLYLPMMHAEDHDIQAESVRKFEELGNPYNLRFAIEHADVIRQFGRFPTRNDALTRAHTAEEVAFLSKLAQR
ncbi:DUF924 family protein [Terrihabitans sp. B22-R8]|uniref:DUF924 family protein n=1 Tax=Terrihabitans sp. B22-R8 TaxID=3425128 RepID=UPI00403CDD9F